MKKTLIFLSLNLIVILSAKGQFNPIKDLSWIHTYETPNNCFNLSWTKPDLSLTDTLLGYNIYRDDSLYAFTTLLNHSCNPCVGLDDETFCDFLNFTGKGLIGQFYIHVTAVYNHDNKESIFTDSIYNQGIALGVKNVLTDDLTIINIIQVNSSIRVELNQSIEDGELIITNISGQVTSMFSIKNQKNIELGISNCNPGIYFLTLKTSKVNLARKILIK